MDAPEHYVRRKTLSSSLVHELLDEYNVIYRGEDSFVCTGRAMSSNTLAFVNSSWVHVEPRYYDDVGITVIPHAIKCPLRYSDFEAERGMLQACNGNRHPHIIPLIATFESGGIHGFVLPRAVTDLATLFRCTRQQETEEWLTTQIAGLSGALTVIHCQLHTIEHRKLFGLHGDIKPSNVLVFQSTNETTNLPILRLADFGLSQLFNSLVEASTISCTFSCGTYTAPECVLEQPYSQAADIWSLGCLILEFLTWFKLGPESLRSFAMSRMHESSPYGMALTADYFFKLEPVRGGSEDQTPYVRSVNSAVTTQINRLRLVVGDSTFLKSLLDLLELRILVINSTQRISANALALQLKSFFKDTLLL